MKLILIIAGPNGAGKTSFANQFLGAGKIKFVFMNADEIARNLGNPHLSKSAVELHAAREMLTRIDALVAEGVDFMFETTLASLTYAQKITEWRKQGYYVTLIYLRLPSVEASLERVHRRVAAGGHDVPEAIVRQRFAKSLAYFEKLLHGIVGRLNEQEAERRRGGRGAETRGARCSQRK